MIVDIPSTGSLNGFSPELRVQQRINQAGLPCLLAFADAFFERFNVRLVITEGARSRARQQDLWNRRKILGVAVAAPFTSIHDEVEHGFALDLGSGIATLNSERANWTHSNGPRYGLHWTGVAFKPRPESWHHEIRPGSQIIQLASFGERIEESNDMGSITDKGQLDALDQARNNSAKAAASAAAAATDTAEIRRMVGLIAGYAGAANDAEVALTRLAGNADEIRRMLGVILGWQQPAKGSPEEAAIAKLYALPGAASALGELSISLTGTAKAPER